MQCVCKREEGREGGKKRMYMNCGTHLKVKGKLSGLVLSIPGSESVAQTNSGHQV